MDELPNTPKDINLVMDERAVRALLQAVIFTCDKWPGGGDIDQEELYCLKPFLQAAILEIQFNRD